MGKSEKRWLAAAIVQALLAAWFLFLSRYIYNSAANAPPSPHTSGEGDMVSVFLIIFLLAVAALSAVGFLICLLIFAVKFFRNRRTQTNENV